jgi:hypothetical protein
MLRCGVFVVQVASSVQYPRTSAATHNDQSAITNVMRRDSGKLPCAMTVLTAGSLAGDAEFKRSARRQPESPSAFLQLPLPAWRRLTGEDYSGREIPAKQRPQQLPGPFRPVVERHLWPFASERLCLAWQAVRTDKTKDKLIVPAGCLGGERRTCDTARLQPP